MKENFKNEERLKQLAGMLPAGLDSYQTMRVLTEYMRSLEETFEELKKSMASEQRQLDSDCRALTKKNYDQKQEMERLTSDLVEVANSMEEQESVLTTSNLKISNYEKQLKKISRENNDLTNKLTQKENDASFYRQELERSVRDNGQLTASLQAAMNKIEELERKVVVEHETSVMHLKEARRLSLDLSEGQGKVALTEQKMEETVGRFNDEIRRLTGRRSADSLHEVILLKKRVRSSTAPEMRELDRLVTDRLTIETASHLKALVGRLVTKLEQAGLELI